VGVQGGDVVHSVIAQLIVGPLMVLIAAYVVVARKQISRWLSGAGTQEGSWTTVPATLMVAGAFVAVVGVYAIVDALVTMADA
jgi:hypothetical protein